VPRFTREQLLFAALAGAGLIALVLLRRLQPW